MILANELFKRFFIWGVATVAVMPRQHIDRPGCCSIGGHLSYSYKKLLLGLVAINFVRLLMKDSRIKDEVQMIRDILGIAQQLGNSFLCFLSPYILQTWLADTINIRPGANLRPALYAVTALSVAGSILARTWHANFWALRKIGNAISSWPVLRTLTTFNSVTSRGGFHEGRGTILSQTLMAVEYWYVLGQVLGLIGFAMNRGSSIAQADSTQLDELWSAFRMLSFVLDWTRILAHSIFINQLDELHLAQSGSSSNANDARTNDSSRSPNRGSAETRMTTTKQHDSERDMGNMDDNMSMDLVPLVNR